MEELTKALKWAEIKRRSVCVPKGKQRMFPKVGQKLTVKDEETGTVHEIVVGSQCRLIMPSWYGKHKGIREGDVIKIRRDNGSSSISIIRRKTTDPFERKGGKLSIMEGRVFDLIIDALAEIEEGGVQAIVNVGQNGISIEWGKSIRSTEIILGATKVSSGPSKEPSKSV